MPEGLDRGEVAEEFLDAGEAIWIRGEAGASEGVVDVDAGALGGDDGQSGRVVSGVGHLVGLGGHGRGSFTAWYGQHLEPRCVHVTLPSCKDDGVIQEGVEHSVERRGHVKMK